MSTAANVTNLLDAVRIRAASLAEAKRRYAAELAPDFHLVDHLRNNEVALSRYLALLLDIRGVHGQGDLFLSGLLRQLELDQSWCEPRELLRVELEKPTRDGRRLDIWLQFRGGVIGIENKPWAADQERQLTDYAGFLREQARGGHWLLIYACNGQPSEGSLTEAERQRLEQAGHYAQLDFHQIAEWLDECACHTRAPQVRLFVEALSAYVRRYINGELDVSDAQQIKEVILQQPEHLEAALLVAQTIEEVKPQLLQDFKHALDEAMQAEGMGLVWDEKIALGRTYAGFGALLHPEHQLHLRFEFGAPRLNSLEWGICRNNPQIELVKESAEAIANAMDVAYGVGERGWPAWPWYPGTGPRDRVLNDDERDWGTSIKPWLLLRDQSEQGFVQRIVRLARQAREVLAAEHDAMCLNRR